MARVVLLALGALLAVPALVCAQPAVRLQVQGSCPSEGELAAALARQVRAAEPGEPAWAIEVLPAPPRASLRLRAPDGAISVDRAIESEDCEALAQAFALIVLAQFGELQLLAEPPPVVPTAPPPASTAVQPAHTVARDEPEPAPAPELALDLALLAGADLGVAPFSAAPAAGFGLGLGPRAGGWLARLDVRLSAPVQQRSATDRVERWGSALRAELGGRLPLGRDAWLAGTAGGGVTLVRVIARDLAGEPGTLRVWPAISAAALCGVRLGARWALRLQAGASVYPRTDRYVVDPEGVVAKSPRAELSGGVGLQFDSPL